VAAGNVAVGTRVAVDWGRAAVGATAVGMPVAFVGIAGGVVELVGPQADKARIMIIKIGKTVLLAIVDSFHQIDSRIILPAKN
jgi:hypothetical protein